MTEEWSFDIGQHGSKRHTVWQPLMDRLAALILTNVFQFHYGPSEWFHDIFGVRNQKDVAFLRKWVTQVLNNNWEIGSLWERQIALQVAVHGDDHRCLVWFLVLKPPHPLHILQPILPLESLPRSSASVFGWFSVSPTTLAAQLSCSWHWSLAIAEHLLLVL